MNTLEFNECIRMLYSDDPMTFEDGYHWLQPHLSKYLDQLIELMLNEQNPKMRAKFVELLGDSKELEVIPYLERELENPDSEVRSWAYNSLIFFGDERSELIAQNFKREHPNESFF